MVTKNFVKTAIAGLHSWILHRLGRLEISEEELLEVLAEMDAVQPLASNSGAIYTNAKKHEYHIIHKHKLEICEYIINNTPGNVIIAYHFQSDKDMLMSYLTDAGFAPVVFDGTPEMELAWNQKKIPILLLQPASCGRGLNLQEGGHTIVWYGLTWSLELYQQANARLYRQGQEKPVIIHHLIAEGTVDEQVMAALQAKDTSQAALLAALKERTGG